MVATIDDHFEAGRRAALAGCYRVLCEAPSREHFAAWLAGYDSVPREERLPRRTTQMAEASAQ